MSSVVREASFVSQFCTMAIGSPTEFLHNLGQFRVISRDQFSALIEARFSRRRGLRPIGAKIHFLECVLLAQLTQSYKRLAAHRKIFVTLIDHTLFIDRSFLLLRQGSALSS